MEKAVQEAKSSYDVDLIVVVTDNASNMISMGRQIGRIHSRCNAHLSTLLLKDLAKGCGIDDLLPSIIAVQKEFLMPGPTAELKRLGGRSPIPPNSTRWCSNRNAIKSYMYGQLSFIQRSSRSIEIYC